MRFVIPHEPLPTPRARVSTHGGFARAYTPAKVKGHSYRRYIQAIQEAFRAAA